MGTISKARRKFTLEEEVWLVKYGAGYKFGPWELGENGDSQELTLIPWVGGLYFHDDWEVKVSPLGKIFDGVDIDETVEFNTPMVGLGSRWNLSERWYVNLSYGYGGWDVDSIHRTYNILGNVAYRFDMWDTPSKFLLGYRYFDLD